MVDITRTVHKAVAPQVGKVIQGMQATNLSSIVDLRRYRPAQVVGRNRSRHSEQ
jgi:hypothetical protein